MKRIISFLLAMTMIISVAVVSTSASVEDDPYYSWNEGAMSVTDAVTQWEKENHPVQKYRYYFLMPNGKNGDRDDYGEYAPSWYNEYTETAGIYWWDSGVADPPSWIGYIAEKCTGLGEDDIYYADVPDFVTNIVWNNGINGGEDKTQDIYYKSAQSINIGTEYYDPGESDYYPNGTENFDNMIYVIEPGFVNVGDFSLKQTCVGEWYYYYGNGCYGFTPGGKSGSKACLRDDHYNSFQEHVLFGYNSESDKTLVVGQEKLISLDPGETLKLTFTPEYDSYFTLFSSDEAKGIGCDIFDENGDCVYSEVSYGNDLYSFDFVPYLYKGENYTFHIKNNSKNSYKDLSVGFYLVDIMDDPMEPEDPTVNDTWENEEDPFKDAPTKTGEIHFDVKSTGWKNVTKVYAHVWDYDGYGEWPAWQSKTERCEYNETTGIATYDLSKTGNDFKVGKPYVVIFSDYLGRQTYNLLFSTDCFGDTAYCDRKAYEDPYDNSKTAQVAFWSGQDEAKYGPVKVITSIGNVVGTCIPVTENPQKMFEDFLRNTLSNARTYARNEDGTKKTDQQILDDTAKALGLKKDNVTKAIENTRVTVSWKASKSKLSSGYVEFENDLPAVSGRGDVDGDGSVTVMDATAIQQYKAELLNLTSSQRNKGDVDDDGSLTVMDATKIQKFKAELIDKL